MRRILKQVEGEEGRRWMPQLGPVRAAPRVVPPLVRGETGEAPSSSHLEEQPLWGCDGRIGEGARTQRGVPATAKAWPAPTRRLRTKRTLVAPKKAPMTTKERSARWRDKRAVPKAAAKKVPMTAKERKDRWREAVSKAAAKKLPMTAKERKDRWRKRQRVLQVSAVAMS